MSYLEICFVLNVLASAMHGKVVARYMYLHVKINFLQTSEGYPSRSVPVSQCEQAIPYMARAKRKALVSGEVKTAFDIAYGFRLDLSYCNELPQNFDTARK